MSKQMSVLLTAEQHGRYRAAANAEGITLSAWVRRALNRHGSASKPRRTPEERMAAVERAMAIPESERVPVLSPEQYRRWYEETRYGPSSRS